MIQYLQSWFPGWGGWYGESQDPDRPQELLQSPSSWNILGELGDRGTFDKCQLRTVLHLFFICLYTLVVVVHTCLVKQSSV